MEAERRELLRNLMTSPVEDFEPFENEDEILGMILFSYHTFV